MSKDQKHGKSEEGITPNNNGIKRRDLLLSGSSLVAASALLGAGVTTAAQAQKPPAAPGGQRPNIIIIWGDDIGLSDVSAYSQGLMGSLIPNIDRVARGGVLFTDLYAEQSCTAGRASFITGQSGLRTGLTKVGLPGATLGLQKEDLDDCRVAQAARLCDRAIRQEPSRRPQRIFAHRARLRRVLRQSLPPECRRRAGTAGLPEKPGVPCQIGPRGVMDCKASDIDDPTIDPRFGKVGKQVIKDTGPLTRERMITIDDDIANRSVDFIQRQQKAGKPFLLAPPPPPFFPPVRTLGKPVSRHDDRSRQECRHAPQGAR